MDAAKRTPPAHRWLDEVSGYVILILVVWAPWAFGCTITWAINVLVAGCYALGLMLALKGVIRRRADYRPERWVTPTPAGRWALRILAALTILFLAWVFAAAVNARGEIEITRLGPILHEYERTPLDWLPASYNAPQTWRAGLRWTALALAFWAVRDWLIGKSRHEKHNAEEHPFPTDRVRTLLWTLALSSAALAVVGMLQRFDGTTKLLWLLEPPTKRKADFVFATYAYRSNAAQYFNLVWPAVLAFAWCQHLQAKARNPRLKVGTEPTVLLLPLIVLMIAVPFVAASRGAAMVAMALMGGFVLLTATQRRLERRLRWTVLGLLLAAMGLGIGLGGTLLKKRFESVLVDQMGGREQIYETGLRMLQEFGWRGSGAETFVGLNFLYRTNPTSTYWAGYLHDDWMETAVTLGWVGLGLVVALLLAAVAVWNTQRGPRVEGVFPVALGLGLIGLLVHAKFDLPFQIVSLQFLFLVMCALLVSLPRRNS